MLINTYYIGGHDDWHPDYEGDYAHQARGDKVATWAPCEVHDERCAAQDHGNFDQKPKDIANGSYKNSQKQNCTTLLVTDRI